MSKRPLPQPFGDRQRGVSTYPVVRIESFQHHINEGLALDNESAASLNHRHLVSMLIILLSNVMTGVAGPNYDCFLARRVLQRFRELGGMDQTIALEIAKTLDIGGKAGFTGSTSGLNHMFRM